MKYKLINNITKEEHLCDKVTVDDFDYYVSNEKCIKGDLCYDKEGLPGHKNNKYIVECLRTDDNSYWNKHCKKIIATNNQNIDIPKVIDEIEVLAENIYPIPNPYDIKFHISNLMKREIFKAGYNKSQETHSFSEEDIILFAKYLSSQMNEDGLILNPKYIENKQLFVTEKELLEIWKNKKIKTLYYE